MGEDAPNDTVNYSNQIPIGRDAIEAARVPCGFFRVW